MARLRATLLAWLCCTQAAALLLRPAGFTALAQLRLRPRACSGGAVMLDAPLVEQLPTLLVVDGNPLQWEEGNYDPHGTVVAQVQQSS